MKGIALVTVQLFCSILLFSQTRQGDILSQERCKEITEYYCKQYIVEDILKVPDKQSIGVYIYAITAAKSGELTTVLYQCDEFNKKGLVFAFWNDYSANSVTSYKGYGLYHLDFEQAGKLLNELESIVGSKNKILDEPIGNLVYRSDELTFLFYNKQTEFGFKPVIRVWWNNFDSDWTISNLETTIKRFRKFFGLAK